MNWTGFSAAHFYEVCALKFTQIYSHCSNIFSWYQVDPVNLGLPIQ
jgi:hypothetical protein